MSLPTHLVPDLDGVRIGDLVTVDGEEAHHAVAVRRLRVGEQVLLTDGVGHVVVAEITHTAKRTFDARALQVRQDAAPLPAVTVVQALPKGDRGELAVEVLTEIGVGRIIPWAADRSVAVWRGERAEKSHAKWRSTAREAAKQARRSWHPVVDALATTTEVAAVIAEAPTAVVLHESGTARLADVGLGHGPFVVVVGPEGGLTAGELETFAEAGAVTVRLGTEVLRTSTAGVAAVAALLSRTNRWA
ncbi:16S rRNA (uracil(1498)-N(3))-methyltransferase [Nocardioides sp. R-C-SC26]|uniref:16S rRNA (uracil(1498)-N(3))-methyltransferase n=1 Tax=Nocardioides sp. R-C-SC26 TaxID=2870414 RepID=UPI001E4EBF60|nr:16S rRNA (uracil(1498)-N(3))-methyltransferase [Nocardioides sp. R-C-SC26]